MILKLYINENVGYSFDQYPPFSKKKKKKYIFLKEAIFRQNQFS